MQKSYEKMYKSYSKNSRIIIQLKKFSKSQALVVHTYNPSYSGGRDQEHHGSKPAHANSSQDLISKKPINKRAGGVAQGVSPKFKLQYLKKKKKKKKP
jgi:hypothetical protein